MVRIHISIFQKWEWFCFTSTLQIILYSGIFWWKLQNFLIFSNFCPETYLIRMNFFAYWFPRTQSHSVTLGPTQLHWDKLSACGTFFAPKRTLLRPMHGRDQPKPLIDIQKDTSHTDITVNTKSWVERSVTLIGRQLLWTAETDKSVEKVFPEQGTYFS